MVTYAVESKAELDKQTDATLSKNVKFDAFFVVDEKATHYKTADLNKEVVDLVVSIDVQKEGYLKNATIDLKDSNGNDNLNFTITDLKDESAIVQSASENQLVLRQINSGSKIQFIATIAPGVNNAPNIEKLIQDNVLTLKGLYINGEGEETPIEKDIKINMAWNAKYEAQIEQKLIKYIPLEQEEGNKTLVSMQIEAGLKEEKFMLPVKETKIEITAPVIANEKPEQVTVIAMSTEATNGLTAENMNFTDENWEYNYEQGTLEIKVPNEKNMVGKNKDQYIINYVYSEKVYTELEQTTATINQQAKATMETYTSTGTETAFAEVKAEMSLSEEIGKLISLDGSNITESIPKGKLYANINHPESNNVTEYEYKWLVNIAYTDGLEGIIIEDTQEKMTNDRTKKDLNRKTIYKTIVFNSNSFDELLGEDGRITIYNKEDRLLGIVAKDTRTDKNGNYLIELLEEISQIKIVTSKPVKSGNLVINITKQIKSDLGFSKAEIDGFTNLETTAVITQIAETTNEKTLVEEKTISIPLEASVTKSQVSINKEKLTTLIKNEEVEFTIELGNDNENSDLYIDPIFEIELPNCIENVEILDYKVLFDEELVIEKVEFMHKNGIPVLRVMLDGVQTKFNNGVVANGTNVVIKTNIIVNKLTPSSTEQIKMYYYNSNTVNYENGVQTDRGLAGLATANIEFSAPTGMLTIGGITNYDGKGNQIMSVQQGEVTELITTYQPSRTLKMHMIAINNTGNTCSDIVLLGRVPTQGNKDIESGEELGTTIGTYLPTKINSETLEGEGVKIYYTENADATSALGDEKNGWTLEPASLDKVKSFMIVLEGYEMPQGQMITFTYDIVIPANIGYNHTINSNFGMYFVNNTQVATVSSFAKSDKIGITTGRGPELEITQTVEGATEGKVDSYKILKYTINITNKGTEAAKNVSIENQIPKWTSLVRMVDSTGNYEIYINEKDKEIMKEWNVIRNATDESGSAPTVGWTISNINPGETVTREVYVLTRQSPGIYEYYAGYQGFTVEEDGKYYITTSKYDPETDTSYEQKNEITNVPEIDVQNITLVTASNINAILKSSSETVTVEERDIKIEEQCELGNHGYLIEGEKITIGIGVSNTGTVNQENITIEKILPEGLKYQTAYIMKLDLKTGEEKERIYGEYNRENRKITFKNQNIASGENLAVVVEVEIENLDDGYEKEIRTSTRVYDEKGKEIVKSEDIILNIAKPQYTLELKATNTNQRINAGDEIEYYIKVTNIGKLILSNINITQYLPEQFVLKEAKYVVEGQTINLHKTKDGNINLISMVDIGKSLLITIKIRVAEVKEDTEVITYAKATGNSIDTEITEMITQVIEKQELNEGNQGGNGEGSGSGNGNGTGSGGNGGTNTPGNIERTYKIAGTAWLDNNENGIREKEEQVLSNIMVIAINADTGEIAKDPTTGENVQAATGTDGKYLLTNLKAGNYLVVFKYDTVIYKTTSYQIQDATELNNSDAVEKTISENGTETLAGVTNNLNVNATLSNIDIGLVERAKFDLKLDKTIKQVTVQNGDGVKSYNYEDTSFAKVEIKSKEFKNSTVVIEYTIKITNEGNVPGYAKQIVDYKPSDLTFNSDLNTNWYEGNDGNVYTTELEKILINPGETKEVKLLLTKKMNDTSTIMLNNRAEIQESISEQGTADKDSTAGNNAQGEDDISLADTIITIQTGGPVFYGFITLLSLTILACGIYIIKITTTKKSEEVYK